MILTLFIFNRLYRLLKNHSFPKIVLFFSGWFFILLLPFLGLGNIAERYLHTAQLGYFALLALFVVWLANKLSFKHRLLALFLPGLITLALISFYLNQLEQAKNDWRQAGETTNKILLAISSNYQEFARANIFFVNLPIRYDRAWVFPVGIEDGIWLVYRTSDMVIKRAATFEEALQLGSKVVEPHIFIFENGELQEFK